VVATSSARGTQQGDRFVTTRIALGRMARPTILVAALAALALSLWFVARPVAAGLPENQVPIHQELPIDSTDNNFSDEDCGPFTSGVVWHFILNKWNGSDGELFATFDSAGVLSTGPEKVLENTQHFYVNTPTEDTLTDAYVQLDSAPGDAQLQLSHICHFEEASPTPTPEQTEEASATQEPSEEASQTTEQSELPATGTPAASESTPDGALALGGVSPLPTVIFSLILLASLASLAYANVRTARSRS